LAVDQRRKVFRIDPRQAGLIHAHCAGIAQDVIDGQHHLAAVSVQGLDLALDGEAGIHPPVGLPVGLGIPVPLADSLGSKVLPQLFRVEKRQG
jgi:hypothetical protein